MKRIIGILILVSVLTVTLAGCGLNIPRPEVKEGKFEVSVTYELDGEAKTLDLVYICKYDGIGRTIEGTSYRGWNGHFDGYEDGELIEIAKTAEGDKIALCFLIYPEYFMGEPDYADDFYPIALTNVIYYEDGVEMINDDQDAIAESYGVRVINIECGEPIENTFKKFNFN